MSYNIVCWGIRHHTRSYLFRIKQRKVSFMVLKIFRSKKFTKRTLIVLLVLIIPAFVLWGVGNLGSGPELIGKIEGRAVYPRDLAKSADGIKTQILFSHGDNFNVFSQILKNRVLINYMAWERLILLNASRGKSPKISFL